MRKFQHLSGHWLVRHASWLFIGQISSFVFQALNFILLARLLGVFEYGKFAGAFAFVSIITPYSAIGASMLFMRYVSQDHSVARTYWGNGLFITGVVSIILVYGLAVLGPRITDSHNAWIFVALTVANCFFQQIVTLASGIFQTFQMMRMAGALIFTVNLCRLVCLLIMQMGLKQANALQWSIGVMFASAVAAGFAVVWVTRQIGFPRVDMRLAFKRLWEGFGFSIAGSTQSIYNDMDKTMLSHYGLTRENGFYTLAYRVINVATTPIMAIDSSMIPRYFQMGRQNMRGVVRLVWKAVGLSCSISVAIFAMLWLVAPLVPRMAGHDFSEAIVALRWLSVIPFLRSVHQSTGCALTGTGYQNRRTIAQFVVAGINILLNVWWIPKFGWIGAAWSSVASDGALGVMNTLILIFTWHSIKTTTDTGEREAAV